MGETGHPGHFGWFRRIAGSVFWGVALLGMLLVSLPAAALIFLYGLVTFRRRGSADMPGELSPLADQAKQLAAFPTASSLADRAIGKAIEANGGGELVRLLGSGLRDPLAQLAETELPALPEQGPRISDEQYRARLAIHVGKLSNPAYLAELDGFLEQLATTLLGELRLAASTGTDTGAGAADGADTRPLVELLADLRGAVAAIVRVTLEQSPPAQFMQMKSILAANIGIVGNVLPADYRGSTEALLDTYLQGTPFLDFFYVELPRRKLVAA